MIVRQCVIVIDSDERARTSTVALLNQRNVQTFEASSIAELKPLLAAGTPAVIVIEPELASVDGFELARTITSTRKGTFPAIILASRRVRGKEAHVRAKEVGACMFVERPTYDKVLVEAVVRLLTDLPGFSASAPTSVSEEFYQSDALAHDAPAKPEYSPEQEAESIDLTHATEDKIDDWVDAAFSFGEESGPVTGTQSQAQQQPQEVALMTGESESGPASEPASEPGIPSGVQSALEQMPSTPGVPLSTELVQPEIPSPPSIPLAPHLAQPEMTEEALGVFRFDEEASTPTTEFPSLGPVAEEPVSSPRLHTGPLAPPPQKKMPARQLGKRRRVRRRSSAPLVAVLVLAAVAVGAYASGLLDPYIGKRVQDSFYRPEPVKIEGPLATMAQLAGFYEPVEIESVRLQPQDSVTSAPESELASEDLDAAPAQPAPFGERVAGDRPAVREQASVAPARPEPAPRRTARSQPRSREPVSQPRAAKPAVVVSSTPPPEPSAPEPSAPEPLASPPAASRQTAETSAPLTNDVASRATDATGTLRAEDVARQADGEPTPIEEPSTASGPVAEFASGDGTDVEPADLNPEPFAAADESAAAKPVPEPPRVHVTPPRVIESSKRAPRLPPLARTRRVGGRVQLEVIVMPDGTVGPIRILSENPKKMGFGKAAINAVKNWRYEPGNRGGDPAALPVQIQLVFSPGR